ncbi:hypothetical protein NEF87_003030 [Candidatus Lokiarchaeum ossiferum]|uniref:Tetratricopeptide repeat protein n=1 Tax=Candidatus Lokiarchaeum ossiferum TaxID=2951803 RepID=A0ABY6HTJ2_9ARCH|nr:hypothetical protein NEF87_003030 [Candidatus Lokiarchaeum sp. B-35]
MYDSFDEDDQAELIRAQDLMAKGEIQGKEGNIRGSIHLYVKALEIFLNTGRYLRISEVFNKLISFVTSESQILLIMEQIRNTISEIEYLDIPEELAKLKQALADLHYKNSDFLSAGNLFIEVAELFSEVDPEEYRQASGMFLLRAGECFEKIGRIERAERLILDAIQKFDTTIFDYQGHIKELHDFIQKKKYQPAIDHLREVALFFRNLEKELEDTPEYSESFRNLKNNVNARLLHMLSEYNLIKTMCYRHLKDEDKVREQADKSIKDLAYAIEIIKDEFKDHYYSSADLHRITFDLFLLQLFQEFADYQVEDPLDLVMRGLPTNIKEIIRKLSFYEETVKILELDLKGRVDIFDDLPLSQILEPFRSFIIKSIKI